MVGARAWQYAAANMPDVAAKAKEVLSRSSGGKDVAQLVNSKSPATQQAIVKTLLESGMDAKDFVSHVQLTADEARQYSQLILAAQVRQQDRVDASQAPAESTGDASLDRVVRNVEIEDMVRMLGISSDDYAKFLRCVNSHTSKDVEHFQLDRRIRRQSYL